MALGHTVFELPYVSLLAYLYTGLYTLLENSLVKTSMAVAMALVNSFFIYSLFSDSIRCLRGSCLSRDPGRVFSRPLVAGILLTGLNPFFLLWWASVGAPLIQYAVLYGAAGLAVMYVSHVWLDYLWLVLLAHATHSGARLLGPRTYATLLAALATVLALFTVDIVSRTLLQRPVLPY